VKIPGDVQQLQTGHLGHVEIQQTDVERPTLQKRDGVFGTLHRRDVVSEALEECPAGVSKCTFVIDDQDVDVRRVEFRHASCRGEGRATQRSRARISNFLLGLDEGKEFLPPVLCIRDKLLHACRTSPIAPFQRSESSRALWTRKTKRWDGGNAPTMLTVWPDDRSTPRRLRVRVPVHVPRRSRHA